MIKNILLHSNDTDNSLRLSAEITERLKENGFNVLTDCSKASETDFIISVGGDGTFLSTLRKCGFPRTPVIGVNSGHLGFFEEIGSDDIDSLVNVICKESRYSVQFHRLLKARITSRGKEDEALTSTEITGLNDVSIKSGVTKVVHLKLRIGSNVIESYSGDGVLISSSAGSTGYNYSLGGSIVDPRIDLLMLTPIAPMNNRAYRSFTSSIILPPDMQISIRPEERDCDSLFLTIDGVEYHFSDVDKITVRLSAEHINLVRSQNYNFWSKVQSKFL